MDDPAGVWLAIDTATDRAGVALHDGVSVVAEQHWTSRRRHSAELAEVIQTMLDRQGLTIDGLDGVAVAGGPGSYTGLRVGMALAKGLALGRGLPLVAVPTLDILAAPWCAAWSECSHPLWAVLAAGRGRFVAAAYRPAAHMAESALPFAPLITPPAVFGQSTSPTQSTPAHLYQAFTLETLLSVVRPPAWVVGELDQATRAALVAAGLTVLPPAAGSRRAGWLAELGRARAEQSIGAAPTAREGAAGLVAAGRVESVDVLRLAESLAVIVPTYAEPERSAT